MNFTLKQLTYVQAAADHRSIASAAQKLRISASSIGAAIDGFEQRFEIQIFVRQPSKGLMLTPPGKVLIEKINHLLLEAKTFDAQLSGHDESLVGELVVGCFAPITPHILPLIVRAMKSRFPGLIIRILEGDLREVNGFLASGAAEITLGYDLGLPEGISFTKLGEVRPHAIFSTSDPLANRKSVSITELVGPPMILLDLPESRTYFDLLFSYVRKTPNIAFRTGTYETVRSLVAAGMGFSILNLRPAIDQTYTGNEVVCVPLEEDLPAPSIGFGFRIRDYISPAAREFAEECKRVFATERVASMFVPQYRGDRILQSV
ncbi:LysR family transcriptional regulator [Thalassospira alkalitolerans]|uniref:HTH lysR-type domain-containing protein n=1 Tax=Thalassospira alkalitolerans TaxID=1293890 RepID=A0A1Y2L5Y8_9PROT|nr:LysR family transcriptional regulator [Thalassospira alkalitolerans]OSQ43337.1 hypothetical protein TALK_20540 [Thalassospira alkalitolerans]|tara:strand:+ start:7196 stop:8152 length:957 start_codon:yes stop_codon:yes gene_type:complete